MRKSSFASGRVRPRRREESTESFFPLPRLPHTGLCSDAPMKIDLARERRRERGQKIDGKIDRTTSTVPEESEGLTGQGRLSFED